LELLQTFLGRPLHQAADTDLERYWHSVRDVKPATLRRKQAATRQFFRYCLRMRLVEADPTVNFIPPKMPQRLPTYLGLADVERLFRQFPANGDAMAVRDTAILKLFYYTGMRASEVEQVNLGDILWEEQSIRVFGKGRKERLIPLHAELSQSLQRWLEVRPRTPHRSLFVTLRPDYRRLSYQGLYFIVKRSFKRANIDVHRFSPHKLRHTFATHLLSRRVAINEISKLLGHSRLDTTQIYAHTDESRLRAAIERL
ncbi:MAG: tyrosine-type recombinase/integrase, partial [Chloroflexi bacterium]|nr:tyrosine-type recombinase/integrase [Chloroflexota bacterium]